MFTVQSLAALRSADPAAASGSAAVLGCHEPGDEGGGTFRWVPGADHPDDGGTVVASDADGSGRWVRDYSGAADVHWFGARADGSNDTPAIQAALDASAHVTLRAGRTYVLGRSARHGYGELPVCLVLNQNQSLDGQGATLRLASGVSAIILINRTATVPLRTAAPVPTRGIRLRNLELDGNGFRARRFSFLPAVYFTGPVGFAGSTSSVEDVEVANVTIRNSYACAFYADRMRRFTLRDITVENAHGDGFIVSGSNGYIDGLHVDTTHEIPGAVGACHVYDLQDVRVGRLSAVNAWWAYKFQRNTRNVSIDSIVFRGGDQTTQGNKRAVKFQGTPETPLRNIRVGSIEVTDARTNALYLIHVENLYVERYVGTRNGCPAEGAPDLKDCSDVLVLQDAGAVRFGEMVIERPAVTGLWIQGPGQHDLDFGRVRIASPGVSAVAVRGTPARVRFERLALQVANRPSDRAYMWVGDAGLVEVEEYSTDIPIPADRRAVTVDRESAAVRIGRARYGSQAPRANVLMGPGRSLSGSAALSIARLEPWATVHRDVAVPGARPGDVAGAELTPALPAGVVLSTRVTTPGVVRVSLTNLSAAALSLTGTLAAEVWRR